MHRDGVAVSHVGNPSIWVSGGAERIESLTVRVHIRPTIETPVGDMRHVRWLVKVKVTASPKLLHVALQK